MNYLSRVGAAASVAAVQGHTDQGHKWRSGLNSIKLGRRLFSGEKSADIRPLASVVGTDFTRAGGTCEGDERRRQTDESLQRVMYLNCWGQG